MKSMTYHFLRVWHSGCAPDFQSGNGSSTLPTRSNFAKVIQRLVCLGDIQITGVRVSSLAPILPEWLSGDSNGFVSRLRKDTGVRVPLPAPILPEKVLGSIPIRSIDGAAWLAQKLTATWLITALGSTPNSGSNFAGMAEW